MQTLHAEYISAPAVACSVILLAAIFHRYFHKASQRRSKRSHLKQWDDMRLALGLIFGMSLEIVIRQQNATIRNFVFSPCMALILIFLLLDLWPRFRIRFLAFLYLLLTILSTSGEIPARAGTASVWVGLTGGFLIFLALIELDNVRMKVREKTESQFANEEAQKYRLKILSDELARQNYLFRITVHDVNQPLRAAIFLSQTIANATKNKKQYFTSDHAKALKMSIDNAALLLDSAALLAGILAHEKAPQLELFRLGQFIESTALQYHAIAKARGLRLITRSRDEIVHTDPVLLSHILQNLLNNSIEATPSGGVILACRRYGDSIYLEVRDTGSGMELPDPPNNSALHSENKKRPETKDRHAGLGLQIVYDLCNVMGFTFTLRSRLKRGTIARIALPDDIIFRHPRLILIVTNNTKDREFLESHLASWGFCVTTFRKSSQAFASLRTHNQQAVAILICSQSQRFANHLRRLVVERRNEGRPIAAILVSRKEIQTRIFGDLGMAKVAASRISVLRSTLFRLLINAPDQ